MIWTWTVLAPLLAGGWVAARREDRAAVLAFLCLASLSPGLWGAVNGRQANEKLPFVLLGTELGLTETTRVFLLFTAGLWLLSGLFASWSLEPGPTKARYFGFHFLTLSGNLGLVLALNVVSFYTFFTVMAFAAYGLVIHHERERDWRAGRVYLVMTLVGEVCILATIFLLLPGQGALRLEDVSRLVADSPYRPALMVLIWVGFGTKAGALPVHFWLPLAHSTAPAPGSAVLSGSMIKAGLLAWIHFLPLGLGDAMIWSRLVLVLGLMGGFFGIVVGLFQTDPKSNLAYSSISQIGFMTLAFGAGLASEEGAKAALPAILVYAFVHALAKGTLFFSAGMSSWARSFRFGSPLLLAGSGLAVASISGLPFTGGGAAKKLLGKATSSLMEPWAEALHWLLLLGSVGTTLLLCRFLLLMFHKLEQTVPDHAPPTSAWTPWLVGVVCVAAGAWPLWGLGLGRVEWEAKSVLQSVTAVGAGVLLMLLLRQTKLLPAENPVPEGDILVFFKPLAPLYRFLQHPPFEFSHPQEVLARLEFSRRSGMLWQLGALFQRWSVSGVVFVFLLLAALGLLGGGP